MNIVSIDTRDRLLKVFAVITALTTIASLSGFAYLVPTAFGATPADYGLKEGDTISAAGSDDPDVYIVNEHGYKRLFLNPVIFGFYGHLGGFAKVKKVSPATRDAFPTSGLFRNCETNDPKVYGVETTGEDTGVLHWVNTTGEQAVADDPNFFKKVFCINNNEFNWYSKGSDYTSVNQVPSYARVPGQQQQQTGPLSASLAADNPASGTLIETQGLATLARFNVSGSGSVTSVELQLLGISGDSTLANVFLFVNGKRVSDAGSVSAGKVTFNNAAGLFNAPAVLEVRSDVADSTSGQTVGIGLRMLNSTSVNVNGNLHTIAAAPSDLETVVVGTPTGPGNVDPQNGVNVWQSTLTVSNKDVWLKRLTLRDVGTVNRSDIRNFKLFVDGVQVATAELEQQDGKYVHFVLSGSGYLLKTGSRVLRVEADVVGGSSRTFRFGVRGAYDLETVGSNYNASIKPSGTFPAQPSESTINGGSVTTIKASDSPASDLVKGRIDAVLGRFTMTAYGEPIKIDDLTVMATTSDTTVTTLRNMRVLFNGVQQGSTANITVSPSASGKAFTVNYTLQPGSPVTVEVRADLKNAAGTDLGADKTVKVTLKAGSSNALGQVSAAAKNVPTADVDGNTLTVKEGAMTLSKYQALSNQSVSIPASNLLLGWWTLTGDPNEDITVNTIELGFNPGDQWTAAKTTDVRVEVDGVQFGAVKSTVASTASQSFSGTLTLAKNQVRNVKVFGNVTDFTVAGDNDTMAVEMRVTGITALSGTTVYAPSSTGQIIGQTMTAKSGTFTTALATTHSPKIAAGNTTTDALKVRFTSQNDNFTIKTLKFKVDNAAAASTVSSVRLLDNSGNFVAAQPMVLLSSGSYYASFTGLSIPVPNNTESVLTAQLEFGTIGLNAAT